MQDEKLKNLQNEVTEFYKKVKDVLSPSTDFNEDFLGYRIFFGQFIVNPKILFLGFNPGTGKNNSSIHLIDTMPAGISEYYNESYMLVNNAKKVFEAIGKSHWIYEDDQNDNEYNTKFNLFYLITKDIPTFNNILSKLSIELRTDFYKLSYKWTKDLIELIKPKYIYCEGIEVFRKFGEFISVRTIETKIEGVEMAIIEDSDIKVFGIARNRSNYVNRKGVIDLLSKEIE